jgi:hypothetical protein
MITVFSKIADAQMIDLVSLPSIRTLLSAFAICVGLAASTATAVEAHMFNKYILLAIDEIAKDRLGLGYDPRANYTRALPYGGDCCLRPTMPPKTMCVAAMIEVMMEALELYVLDTGDSASIRKVPMARWTGMTKRDLRPYLFRYSGVRSSGIADGLQTFNIGRKEEYADLQPGDFINFRRQTSAHAAVFLGFVAKDGRPTDVAAQSVGFKYFSAQGAHQQDGGFGYRIGLFADACNTPADPKIQRDCGIRRDGGEFALTAGYMLLPSDWQNDATSQQALFAAATAEKIEALSGLSSDPKEISALAAALADQDLDKTIPAEPEVDYSGETSSTE